MGGRKSYPVKLVVGDARKFVKESRELSTALDNMKPDKIIESTVKIFTKSDLAVNNLSRALNMFEFFQEKHKKHLEKKEAKKIVSDYWIKTKEKKNIKTTKEIDNLLINTAANVLSKGGQKK